MKQITVNIAQMKSRFSAYARRVAQGERIILCNHNKPFAEIRPLRLTQAGKRPVGLGKGLFTVPDDFDKPDPDIQSLFENGDAK